MRIWPFGKRCRSGTFDEDELLALIDAAYVLIDDYEVALEQIAQPVDRELSGPAKQYQRIAYEALYDDADELEAALAESEQ